MISGIVLAAGTSSRLDRPKQLLEIRGQPMVQHVVDAADAAGLEETVVVLGYRASEVRSAVRLPERARVVVNPTFGEGQATSLRTGLDALAPEVLAAVVLLGDQPFVSPRAIRSVVGEHRASNAALVRARYSTGWGHPVLLGRPLWDEARALSGDVGARALMRAHPGAVREVEVDGAAPADVDTWEDYRRLLEAGAVPNPPP